MGAADASFYSPHANGTSEGGGWNDTVKPGRHFSTADILLKVPKTSTKFLWPLVAQMVVVAVVVAEQCKAPWSQRGRAETTPTERFATLRHSQFFQRNEALKYPFRYGGERSGRQ